MRVMNYVEKYAEFSPDMPVILSPQGSVLTYYQLNEIVRNAGKTLTELGFRVEDRIAVALPNGFETACAFFAVSNISTFVPLNPGYSKDEFQYYLLLLKANALLVQEDQPNFAQQAAQELGFTPIKLSVPGTNSFGNFLLYCKEQSNPVVHSLPGQNNDLAILLYTSGTTSTPKIIPKTHLNLCTMGENTANAFKLTSIDRQLIIIPLFSTISIVSLLASVAVGGCAICTDGYEPSKFFGLIDQLSPTWFAAGPAVIQSMVEYAEKKAIHSKDTPLRFIRSTGAPLSAKLANRLKSVFDVPIAISYGLAETGNVFSNYLKPQGHKEGSVGVATTGCEAKIINDQGESLPINVSGEIIIRASNIMSYYEDNPQANQESFIEDWFKTGDLGYLDRDGYLFVSGRIKEIINRGGEKVSPYEVEQAILYYPDVSDVVVFPIPNGNNGEDVAAMVVLNDATNFSLKKLRGFLKGRIAFSKMPTRLFSVEHIPIGPNGKIQRNTLFQQLEDLKANNLILDKSVESAIMPRNEIEQKLMLIWNTLFESDDINVQDDFFELGGDSLLVARLYADIEQQWGQKIPLSVIYQEGTVEKLAKIIVHGKKETLSCPFLVPIQLEGKNHPLFCIHALEGEVLSYKRLSFYLGDDQPVYGLSFDIRGFKEGDRLSINTLASNYIRDIQSVRPEGPYFLLGYSLGGKIAFEIANQLRTMGQEVAMIVMFDTITHKIYDQKMTKKIHQIKSILKGECPLFPPGRLQKDLNHLVLKMFRLIYPLIPTRFHVQIAKNMKKKMTLSAISKRYKPVFLDNDIIYFLPEKYSPSTKASLNQLTKLARGVKVINVGGNHLSMLVEPHIVQLAQELKELMAERGISCT